MARNCSASSCWRSTPGVWRRCSRLPRGSAAAAAPTCGSSRNTCAPCARSTRRSRRTRGRRRCRRPPNGCSTTSTSSRPPHATSITICRRRSSGGCRSVAADEFAGLPRIYALALELIGSQRGPARRAAAAAVHQRLPVGHAADDRRALGLAERAEARAARPSARPRRHARRHPRPSPGRGSAGRDARSRTPAPPRVAGARPSLRSSRACCSARARSARSRRRCTSSSTPRWRRADRRSRTRSARKDSTRPPNRPAWPT